MRVHGLESEDAQRFESLHEILGRLRAACERDDWSQAVLLDFALHQQMYVLSGMSARSDDYDTSA